MHTRTTGSGNFVVFIHGAGGNGQLFASQFQAFRDHARCCFIDLPGHGKSPLSSTPTISAYAGAVGDLLKTQAEPVTLVGHSMGGAVALQVALTHKQSVRALILVGTGCRLPVPESALQGLEHNYIPTVDAIVGYCFSETVAPDLLQKARADIGATDPDVVRADFRECAAFDVCSGLSNVNIPALVVCGSGDRMTPLALSEELHGRLQNSTMAIIPDGSHMVMMEQPSAFNRIVLGFLQREDTPT